MKQTEYANISRCIQAYRRCTHTLGSFWFPIKTGTGDAENLASAADLLRVVMETGEVVEEEEGSRVGWEVKEEGPKFELLPVFKLPNPITGVTGTV